MNWQDILKEVSREEAISDAKRFAPKDAKWDKCPFCEKMKDDVKFHSPSREIYGEMCSDCYKEQRGYAAESAAQERHFQG